MCDPHWQLVGDVLFLLPVLFKGQLPAPLHFPNLW